MPGLYKQVRTDGRFEWKIDKRVRNYGRVCESTGTSDYVEAERYLTRRLEQIRQATVFGVRPKRSFREAATEYLNDHRRRRGISRDATALKNLDPYIGDRMIDEIHDGSFDRYREARAKEGISIGWIAARERATVRYKKELGTEPPKGFQRVRAHDLRHTFGRRLRAAGVSLEDRQDLLGHEAGRITTHYSAAEIENLVTAANQITKSRESPMRTVLRLISAEAK